MRTLVLFTVLLLSACATTIDLGVPVTQTCPDLLRAAQLGDAAANLTCMGSCLH